MGLTLLDSLLISSSRGSSSNGVDNTATTATTATTTPTIPDAALQSVDKRDKGVVGVGVVSPTPPPSPPTPPPQGLILITQFYMPVSQQTFADMSEALQLNLDNTAISNVVLLCDNRYDFSRLQHAN